MIYINFLCNLSNYCKESFGINLKFNGPLAPSKLIPVFVGLVHFTQDIKVQINHLCSIAFKLTTTTGCHTATVAWRGLIYLNLEWRSLIRECHLFRNTIRDSQICDNAE
jgi:hypothetical protein